VIVDTSALVAIIGDEVDGPELALKLQDAIGAISLSAGNYLEAGIVIDSNRYVGQAHRLDALISEMDIKIAPVTEAQARIARQAYRDFGKGSGHKAQLNFGDCFAFALAIERNEPLLFKGNDFTLTGVKPA
jgi:ribonuclease VapC